MGEEGRRRHNVRYSCLSVILYADLTSCGSPCLDRSSTRSCRAVAHLSPSPLRSSCQLESQPYQPQARSLFISLLDQCLQESAQFVPRLVQFIQLAKAFASEWVSRLDTIRMEIALLSGASPLDIHLFSFFLVALMRQCQSSEHETARQ